MLSLLPSLLTTLNSISPVRSSITAGFSGKGISFLGCGGASSGASLSCFDRLDGDTGSRGAAALRLTDEERVMLAVTPVGERTGEEVEVEAGLVALGRRQLDVSLLRGISGEVEGDAAVCLVGQVSGDGARSSGEVCGFVGELVAYPSVLRKRSTSWGADMSSNEGKFWWIGDMERKSCAYLRQWRLPWRYVAVL